MIITFHAMLRYAQRVVNIEDDKAEEYVNKNVNSIKLELLDIFEKSTLIIDNYYANLHEGDKHDYYFHKNVLLLVKIAKNKRILRTVYGLDIEESNFTGFKYRLTDLNKLINERQRIEKRKTQQDNKSKQIEYTIKHTEEILIKLNADLEKSINESKEYVEQSTEIRTQIRMFMNDIVYNNYKKR